MVLGGGIERRSSNRYVITLPNHKTCKDEQNEPIESKVF